MFFGGAFFFAEHVSHVHERVEIWLDPFRPGDSIDDAGLPDRPGAVRAGRRRAVRPGLRPGAAASCPGGGTILPAPHTDLIYAVITNELGLFGAAGLVIVYLLLVCARLQDRDAGHGRLLEAARRRPDARCSRCRCS